MADQAVNSSTLTTSNSQHSHAIASTSAGAACKAGDELAQGIQAQHAGP
jgi:hypothetical protein